jgi:hypothetical protein
MIADDKFLFKVVIEVLIDSGAWEEVGKAGRWGLTPGQKRRAWQRQCCSAGSGSFGALSQHCC